MVAMNRVAIKEAAMRSGACKAEFVDQLCENCWDSGRCRHVPRSEKVDSQENANATVAKIQAVANRVNAAIVALKKKYRII